jgi:hypothetical protein
VGAVCFYSVKGKILPRTVHESPEGKQRYSSTLSLISALDGDGWLRPRSGRFNPWERGPAPIVWEFGWAPGPL